MNREDFPMLEKNVVYFDNGATTFKPRTVIDKMNDYYYNYCGNAHRGDYDISLQVDCLYENVRKIVKDFIGSKSVDEIVFTAGSTDSLNRIIFGYFGNNLKKDDEVLITKSEHASNVLPWYVLSEKIKIKVNYIKLNDNKELTLENVKKSITDKTKVISIASITNAIGDERPLVDIIKYAHEKGILVIIDAAQSIAHKQIDVSKLDIDFMVFSAHKLYGPTGVGVLYGKYELLDKMCPLIYGGGMNATFSSDGKYELKKLPHRLEAGTPNIASVIGMGEAINYINSIGIDKIRDYEISLANYLKSRLEEINNVTVYNKNINGTIVTFNVDGVFSQDVSIYLNKYHICVRAGNHCAKILKDDLGVINTCRVSFALYNTKEEIDLFINVLKNNKNIWEEIL